MESQPLPGPTREKDATESGYSEKEQAKVVEGSTVDLKQLKKRKPLQVVSRHEKIMTAYQQTHLQVVTLLEELQTIIDNLRHQEKILEEIKTLRNLQEELMQCLVLEQKGELSETVTSQEAWNLIK